MRVPFLKFGGLFGARLAKPQPTLADQTANRLTCEAEVRRQALKTQLAAMHKNDSRRGEIELELRRHTFVVLSGGRAA